jgi:Ser/Thr protein kinase RdoA (MazF antagonist)
MRSNAEVEAEIQLLQLLDRHNLPVSAPIADRHGHFWHSLAAPEGERQAILFEVAQGHLDRKPSPRRCQLAGEALAQIHAVWDEVKEPVQRPSYTPDVLVEIPMETIRLAFSHHTSELILLDNVAYEVRMWLDGPGALLKDYGLCHADFHEENIHFRGSNDINLFDFDCAGYCWRAYDLAVFFWSRYLLDSDAEIRASRWDAFLAGYLSVRSLTARDIEGIPALAVARQIWIMGLHTGPTTYHYGRRWLDDRYIDKHIGLLKRLAERAGLPL